MDLNINFGNRSDNLLNSTTSKDVFSKNNITFAFRKSVLLNYCKTRWNTEFRWFLNRYLSNWKCFVSCWILARKKIRYVFWSGRWFSPWYRHLWAISWMVREYLLGSVLWMPCPDLVRHSMTRLHRSMAGLSVSWSSGCGYIYGSRHWVTTQYTPNRAGEYRWYDVRSCRRKWCPF